MLRSQCCDVEAELAEDIIVVLLDTVAEGDGLRLLFCTCVADMLVIKLALLTFLL